MGDVYAISSLPRLALCSAMWAEDNQPEEPKKKPKPPPKRLPRVTSKLRNLGRL